MVIVACRPFTMSLKHMPSLFASVVLPDRHTLLLVRPTTGGAWNMPSAQQRAGETIQQAAQRAVLEATGVTVALTNLVGIYTDAPSDRVDVVFSAYITPERVKAPAGIEVRWLAHEEAAANANSSLLRALPDIRRGMRFPLAVLNE